MVDGGSIAHVAQVMGDVAGVENNGAGANALPLAINQSFDRPFADDDDFLLGMVVRRMRSKSGVEDGQVGLEVVQGRRG